MYIVLDQNYRRRAMAAALNRIRFTDANEALLVTRDLEQVQTDVVREIFPQYVNRLLCASKPGIDPAAEVYVWKEYRGVGEARHIANYANDDANIEVYGTENYARFKDFGGHWIMSYRDQRSARMSSVDVNREKAIAALQANEQIRERIVLLGDTSLNLPGFAKNASVPLLTGGYTGNWDAVATTGATILADFRLLAYKVQEQSRMNFRCDTVAVGTATMKALCTKKTSDYQEATVYDTILSDRSLGIKQIVTTPFLDLADAGGDGERAVFYENNSRAVSQLTPVDYEELPPQIQNRAIKMLFNSRLGGAIWEYPLAGVYVDGLLDGA